MTADNTVVKEEGVPETDSMSGHMLEQAEIDGLLKGANSDNFGLKALIQPSTISHERLPMLEVVFDRLIRQLATSLRHFTTDSVDISLTNMTSSRFKDYIENVSLPAMINVIKIDQWNTQALMVIDNPLIFTVVDVLLGGSGKEPSEVQSRPYTTIELTLNQEFLNVILRDLSLAFEPIEAIVFSHERTETNPMFAMIDRPNNAGIIVTVQIRMDGRGGAIEFFIPYVSIEPAREKLLQTFIGEKFGHDQIWESHLAHEVWNTTIEAEAVLDRVTMKLSDVLKWKPGSSLPLETFEGANVVVQCGDRRLYSGKIGNVRKRVAVQIEENFLVKEKQ
jgi:flagellar motor switch protein FliM